MKWMKEKDRRGQTCGNRKGEDKNLLDTIIAKSLMQNIEPVP